MGYRPIRSGSSLNHVNESTFTSLFYRRAFINFYEEGHKGWLSHLSFADRFRCLQPRIAEK